MKNIVFVGLSGALKRMRACDFRLAMFANTMAENNCVQIVNRYTPKYKLTTSNTDVLDSIQQHEIINPRNTGPILSKLLLALSIIIEPFYMIRLNRKEHINVLHVYSGQYLDFLFYHLISRIIRAKVVYQYVEYRSILEGGHFMRRTNIQLCDQKGPKHWDGVIAISTFLEKEARTVNNKLLSIKIPPICDFSLYRSIQGQVDIQQPYILYCGSIGYMDVVDFILDSYRSSVISQSHKLVLVLGGGRKEVEKIAEENTDIVVKSNLSYNDLVLYYKNADALLIPLRNITRDIARFPNKICEYLAASGVILTTAVGEINEYFVDGKSAIMAPEYSVESYKAVLDNLAEGKYDIDSIKKEAYKIGLEYFDTKSVRERLDMFLENF